MFLNHELFRLTMQPMLENQTIERSLFRRHYEKTQLCMKNEEWKN